MAHKHLYLIALGSNQRHHRYGDPRNVLRRALKKLDRRGIRLMAASTVIQSDPIGPSLRRYANGAALVKSKLPPDKMLRALKRIESRFGRRPGGQRWRARVLDLDIVLWDGGIFASSRLSIPHVFFRERGFVLGPAAQIAPTWRDPITGLSVNHLKARLTRQQRLPR